MQQDPQTPPAAWLERGKWVVVILHGDTSSASSAAASASSAAASASSASSWRVRPGRLLACDTYGVAIRAIAGRGYQPEVTDMFIPWINVQAIHEWREYNAVMTAQRSRVWLLPEEEARGAYTWDPRYGHFVTAAEEQEGK